MILLLGAIFFLKLSPINKNIDFETLTLKSIAFKLIKIMLSLQIDI